MDIIEISSILICLNFLKLKIEAIGIDIAMK